MTTPTSITSISQGQIYGAKVTGEELERQLEADPMTRACEWLVQSVKSVATVFRRAKNHLVNRDVSKESEIKARHA